jgi:predicted ATPase
MTLSTEQGFPFWWARGMILQGWALAGLGSREEGIAQMRQGLATYQATGAKLGRSHFLALLAEALVAVHKTRECFYEAELYRFKGELLLARSAEHYAQAEACFRQALEVSRRQQAKSLELRAAMSLSQLRQRQGKRAEARDLLAPIYGWFTEGFDTEDLQEAKALLEELS